MWWHHWMCKNMIPYLVRRCRIPPAHPLDLKSQGILTKKLIENPCHQPLSYTCTLYTYSTITHLHRECCIYMYMYFHNWISILKQEYIDVYFQLHPKLKHLWRPSCQDKSLDHLHCFNVVKSDQYPPTKNWEEAKTIQGRDMCCPLPPKDTLASVLWSTNFSWQVSWSMAMVLWQFLEYY